jgi:hypothetical protein
MFFTSGGYFCNTEFLMCAFVLLPLPIPLSPVFQVFFRELPYVLLIRIPTYSLIFDNLILTCFQLVLFGLKLIEET